MVGGCENVVVAERSVKLHPGLEQIFIGGFKLALEVLWLPTAVNVIPQHEDEIDRRLSPVINHPLGNGVLSFTAIATIADGREDERFGVVLSRCRRAKDETHQS